MALIRTEKGQRGIPNGFGAVTKGNRFSHRIRVRPPCLLPYKIAI
jgi:hypothetical protein